MLHTPCCLRRERPGSTGGRAAFTLIELLVVVAIIAIVMSIVIPALLRAKMAANETSCMGSLKAIITAQEQWRLNALVDVDGDGSGEYAFISELAGVEQHRTTGCLLGERALPSFISTVFGTQVQTSTEFISGHSGFHVRMFLPDSTGAVPGGIPEAIPLPCNALAANEQEQRWVAYGWPYNIGVTGNAAFFANQRGEIYFKANEMGTRWNGNLNMPDALLGNEALAPGDTNLDGFPPGAGLASNDGDVWKPIQ